MGPAATADFLRRLVELAAASCDQEHPSCLVYSAAHIPDRTAHLIGGGPDPTPAMQAAARTLVSAGAEFLAIPCNTAHAYLEPIRAAAGVPVLDMVALTAAQVAQTFPAGSGVALLAATGTVRLGLYEVALRAVGLAPVIPDDRLQECVMAVVRAVKAGARARDRRLEEAMRELRARGAEVAILGCTELPLVVDPAAAPLPLVDATDVLARAALRQAGCALAAA